MDDLGAGDCTTDGTCEEDTAGDSSNGLEGIKPNDVSLLQETTMAIQQFSVVIGVALMFCLLFFVMVAIDKALDFLGEMCTKCCGRKNRQNEVDPAELVGSFKRYKN
eukprot:TRINITY_DN7341_c0_g1_i1.p1 TRINITY_DN7341_c0_g1~~TRINITY_DN7341_c0_g1_i1.p1  ORF type:complete len:107 (-),score=20.86 TRINITY_DN7341_c0_g1_i1:176-496(-)